MRGARLVVLAMIVTGCGPPGPGAPPPRPDRSAAGDSVTVTLRCDTMDLEVPCAFRPAEVTIRVGGAVRWVNADATFHTVTSSDSATVRRPNGRFDHVLDEPREAVTVTFREPGEFPYYCQPHAEFMAGVVRVVG